MPDESLIRFRRVVAASLAELESRRDEVNDLNVFPVADGDTGDNMAMTMRAVMDELNVLNGQPLDGVGREEVVSAVARAALLGALADGAELVTCIAGDGAPLDADAVAATVPGGIELDFHEGGQPAWWWLLCAE